MPHIQYASYPSTDARKISYTSTKDGSSSPNGVLGSKDAKDKIFWTPTPLKPWFWIPLILAMVGIAVGLEVALSECKKRNGWTVSQSNQTSTGFRYALTLPPVIVSMVFVALWAWTDIEIKKMQPYVELVQGDAPPKKSLLLDYTRINNFFVWISAMRNAHWLVALASLMVLMSLSFQPLSASLLNLRDVWYTDPGPTMQTNATLGLNEDANFEDLTYFLTSSSYASANVLFNVGNPPFVWGQYAVTPFTLPTELGNNGTVHANTTAVKSEPNCQVVTVRMDQPVSGGPWFNTASLSGCSVAWNVTRVSPTLFGSEVLSCEDSDDLRDLPEQFRPVVFWFFTYVPEAMSSASFCFPRIQLVDVSVSVNLVNGKVTALTERGPISSSSNFTQFAGNITSGLPKDAGYNGLGFDLPIPENSSEPNPFVLERRRSIGLQMPGAVLQLASQREGGEVEAFLQNDFAEPASRVYQMYLNLVASKVYFLKNQEDIYQEVSMFRKRLFLSDAAVHLLTVALLILALFGTLIHLLHRHDRRQLRFLHQPGTIASAVSIAGHTNTSALIAKAGHTEEEEMRAVLQDRKFRIDPRTMRIVMEGEDGYEYAASPAPGRRRSIWRTNGDGKGGLKRRTWLGEGGVFGDKGETPSGLPRSPLPERTPREGAGRV